METTKVKINFRTGEIEMEGSEQFVKSQLEMLEPIVEYMAQLAGGASGDSNGIENEHDAVVEEEKISTIGEKGLEVPKTFGEWMHKFKDDLNDLDKSLLTAYYVQKASTENDFKTSEVNKSLKEHGIKLSNPSASLQRLSSKKFVFQTRKVGKLKFLRVSSDGISHLKSLLRGS